MNGGEIKDNEVKTHGVIYINNKDSIESAYFIMNGGTVSNNKTTFTTTEYGGGAFYTRRGILTINGGTITGNYSDNKGGAIYNTSYGKTYINGGTISGNTATNMGAGVFYSFVTDNGGELHIKGDAVLQDEIYLDINNNLTKYIYVDSSLKKQLNLKCATQEDGKVVAAGNSYNLTANDMAKINFNSDAVYLALDTANNQIKIATGITLYLGYDANGGENAPIGQELTGTKPISTTISTNTPTRDGYTFAGWNTLADGTGTSYSAGGSISISANTTLYAKWTDSSEPTEASTPGPFLVTFLDSNGSTVKVEWVPYGGSATAPTGYRMKGI